MSRPTQATAELCSIIGRVLDLKKQQDGLGDDIREIYLEARKRGWNKTSIGQAVGIIRKRDKDGAAFDEAADNTAQYLQAYYGTGTLLAPHAHETELPTHDPETGEVDVPAAPVKAAAEISPEHGMESAGPSPVVADGRHDRRNTGGGHEVADSNAQVLERGQPARDLIAVPADPAAARIDAWQMQEDVPEYLRRVG